MVVPAPLAAHCHGSAGRQAWLARLPGIVDELQRRWSLTLGDPFDGGCSWAAPVMLADGASAVLKLGMPHFEGEDEIAGLRLWDGDPTVRLLAADDALGAMLLERCDPGTPLRELPEEEQDVIIARLLRRLWRLPPYPHAFRPLLAMLDHWRNETMGRAAEWPDAGLVREGLRLFDELSKTASGEVVLATDLHAGNVLRARRESWLVIDPKPFVGEPAYDATQHLLNGRQRLYAKPQETIQRFAGLANIDFDRIQLWLFARAAAEPRRSWRADPLTNLAWRISRGFRS
jgi:streptomycin 6-kinase